MRVFVTGATSSLVQVMLKNIIGIDLVKINSLTNSYSDTMIFNLDALKDFERGDFILHAAWNMKKRNIQQSRKINIKGTVDFFESLNVEQQNSFIFIYKLHRRGKGVRNSLGYVKKGWLHEWVHELGSTRAIYRFLMLVSRY